MLLMRDAFECENDHIRSRLSGRMEFSDGTGDELGPVVGVVAGGSASTTTRMTATRFKAIDLLKSVYSRCCR